MRAFCVLLLAAAVIGSVGGSRQLLASFSSSSSTADGIKSSAAPWFCHDLDCPPYELEEVIDGDIELRSYAAGQWVSTNVSDMHYDKAVSTGFMRLFAYISGANLEMLTINMTAPVRVLAIPGDGPFCEDHFKISFFVPFALQGKAPLSISDNVFLDSSPAQRVFVFAYPGYTAESKVVRQAQDTVDRLEQAGLSGDYDASYFYSAGYDSPFRLLNRHNEVWIPAASAEAAPRPAR